MFRGYSYERRRIHVIGGGYMFRGYGLGRFL
jgi:hypothetical protein